MSKQSWTSAAASARQFAKPFRRSCREVVLIGALITVAGCAAPPPQFTGPDPADSAARVPAVDYRSTLGAYRSQRPVEPGDWKDINERVTPRPKPGQ